MSKKIEALRAALKKQKAAAFLIPKGDKHGGENIPASEERFQWLTGFTGSAGSCIVTLKKAAVFLDGRYTLQGQDEIDTALFDIFDSAKVSPRKWLSENLSKEEKIAFDPWLHTMDEIEKLKENDVRLIPTENLIDKIWTDRPTETIIQLNTYLPQYAGKNVEEKFAMLRQKLDDANCTVSFLSSPESIMWLLNIRGCDIDFTPIASCFAIVTKKNISLIINSEKVTQSVKAQLPSFVGIVEEDLLESFLAKFVRQKILVDHKTLPYTIAFQLETQNKLVKKGDPCALLKAVKNETEIQGMKAAQQRDGVVFAKFLHWLEKEIALKELTEIDVVEKLNTLRAEAYNFASLSFSTIAGTGSNGAIVHYRVTPQTNKKLEKGDLFLCDSGSQYIDGTTDVTRTIAIGRAPTAEQKEYFTRVLKGHIALAAAKFPEGVTGGQLDTLARQFLWEEGADYAHGTGHGVGAYLNVHEGPQAISAKNNVPLKIGMILSNEPGYYKEDDFGIRIENMILVKNTAEGTRAIEKNSKGILTNKKGNIVKLKQADQSIAPTQAQTFSFETLTLVPIDLSLIEKKMLTQGEKDWLNTYHQRVYTMIAPILDGDVRKWLKKATAKI
ncbi:MAG: aminopeptidase P family protein [Alphaproteobacteria bacterium]